MKKKVLAILLAFILSLSPGALAVDVFINGSKLKTDTAPVIVQDWTMVPVRAFFGAFGAEVQWDGVNRSVLVKKDKLTILIVMDDPVAMVNGVYKTMEVPPQIINDRAMVPVRFAVEALNGGIQWDGNAHAVLVSSVPTAATPAPTPSPSPDPTPDIPNKTEWIYVGSIESDKYHEPTCSYVDAILKENEIWFATKDEAQAAGYTSCNRCNP